MCMEKLKIGKGFCKKKNELIFEHTRMQNC